MYSRRGLGWISGLIWLALGVFLLWRGVSLVVGACEVESDGFHPFVDALSLALGSVQKVALLLMSLGLILGYFKGRFVLTRTAERTIARINSLPKRARISQVYGRGSILLMVLMMGMGMTLRALGAPEELRGFILVAVGCALLYGSTTIFRAIPNIICDTSNPA